MKGAQGGRGGEGVAGVSRAPSSVVLDIPSRFFFLYCLRSPSVLNHRAFPGGAREPPAGSWIESAVFPRESALGAAGRVCSGTSPVRVLSYRAVVNCCLHGSGRSSSSRLGAAGRVCSARKQSGAAATQPRPCRADLCHSARGETGCRRHRRCRCAV